MASPETFTPEEIAEARSIVDRMGATFKTRVRKHAALAYASGVSVVEAYREAGAVVQAIAAELGWSPEEVLSIEMMVSALMLVDAVSAQEISEEKSLA